MSTKALVTIGLIVGSTIGGFIPELWGAGAFSFSAIIFSSAGAIVGIYLGFRIGRGY